MQQKEDVALKGYPFRKLVLKSTKQHFFFFQRLKYIAYLRKLK